MRIAVTGGAGYIGSHTTLALLEAEHQVLILDNFANSETDVPDRIAAISGRSADVVACDICDRVSLSKALRAFQPEAAVHFAGLKAVGESVECPLEYYKVNVLGSVTLFQELERIGCRRVVFSSSATVYGDPDQSPVTETHALRPTNPYGHSKRMVEQVLEDWSNSDPTLSAISLRYFNPVGAHGSARIGEAPHGVPNNLMPYIAQVAIGWREALSVFGNDYDTPDGTGVRDYIHVVDLAAAHLAALALTNSFQGSQAINVGTGRGYSVLEIIQAFQDVSGREIPFKIAARRPGDVAMSLANPDKAKILMGWEAEKDLYDMCRDTWAWQRTRNR